MQKQPRKHLSFQTFTDRPRSHLWPEALSLVGRKVPLPLPSCTKASTLWLLFTHLPSLEESYDHDISSSIFGKYESHWCYKCWEEGENQYNGPQSGLILNIRGEQGICVTLLPEKMSCDRRAGSNHMTGDRGWARPVHLAIQVRREVTEEMESVFACCSALVPDARLKWCSRLCKVHGAEETCAASQGQFFRFKVKESASSQAIDAGGGAARGTQGYWWRPEGPPTSANFQCQPNWSLLGQDAC